MTDGPDERAPAGAATVGGVAAASPVTGTASSAATSAPATSASPGASASAATSAAETVPAGRSSTASGSPDLPPVALEALAKARADVRRERGDPKGPPAAPSSGRGGGAATRPRSSAWWRFGFPAALVVLFLAVPALFYAGYETVLNSNEGKLVKLPNDPNQPGWEALTEATPTMLVTHVDDTGKPVGVAVLSLTGEGTGGILLIPMNTVLQVPGVGAVRVDEAYKRGGVDGVKLTIEALLGAGMQESVVVDDKQWADLTAPVAPIAVTNRDQVVSPTTGRTLFPKGPLQLTPQQVGPYLVTTGANDDDYNRLLRNQDFWQAWLAKIAAAPNDATAVPGESDTGFGRFVRKLADSQVSVQTLPLQKVNLPDGQPVSVPVQEDVQALVAQLIPFPVSPIPGARVRVRILDGTGTLAHGVNAAPLLVKGGGQIDAVGNAMRFDYATTQLVYHDDEQRPAVERLRAALGVGELVKTDRGNDNADVTVILGKDFAASPAASKSSVITSPPTAVGTTIIGQERRTGG